METDEKTGQNDRNEIYKHKFGDPKAEIDGTSRYLAQIENIKRQSI